MLAWELLEAAAMRIEGRGGVLLAICLVAGCGGDDVGPSRWDTGPGGESWNNSDEVDCASDDDCGPGEACEGGVCQMRRCTDPAYTSVAPLGTRHVFAARSP